jgi:RNA polymerase sigma factor (TIGR02999 family)
MAPSPPPASPGSHGAHRASELVRAWAEGDRAALDELLPLLYAELRQLAERYMRQQPSGHTLQATALVHEAYLRLANHEHVEAQSRAQFFALAARAMRSALVDHARRLRAAKRAGRARRLTLAAAGDVAETAPDVDVLALDEALGRLAAFDPEKGRLVELRYFAGLSIEETAEVLGVSPATVKREWRLARAWLGRTLSAG